MIGLLKASVSLLASVKIEIDETSNRIYTKQAQDLEIIECRLVLDQTFGAAASAVIKNSNGAVVVESKDLPIEFGKGLTARLNYSFLQNDYLDIEFSNVIPGNATIYLTIRRNA